MLLGTASPHHAEPDRTSHSCRLGDHRVALIRSPSCLLALAWQMGAAEGTSLPLSSAPGPRAHEPRKGSVLGHLPRGILPGLGYASTAFGLGRPRHRNDTPSVAGFLACPKPLEACGNG